MMDLLQSFLILMKSLGKDLLYQTQISYVSEYQCFMYW